MIKKLVPERGRLLLELDKVEESKISEHLVAPDAHHQRTRRAIVLAVGKPSRPEDADRFKFGDKVMVSFYTGIIVHDFELGWHDDTHKICRYDEILGKLEE